MEIEYIGERLLAGKIGNGFIVLAFVSALLSALSFFFASKDAPEQESWKRFARIAFYIHSLSIAGIIATLFYLLVNHYFEYSYVWQHSNSEMPLRYILSCFWEGQEGSFLLWATWHVVLGLILLKTSKEWEAPVMTTVSLVQAFLASMLLGVYIFGAKIGSNPFILLRENPDFAAIPLFQNPNYLEKLDGRGLNPLLQNYWMTIHPPTLFLGFAATLIPFAYAIAGLWKRKFNEWQKPTLPWAFFGIMVLGTGILMGGAWAYEALSFGGFWAWDPVENASLVPWITLVGAAHVMLIHKNKGHSLFTTFFLTLLTFILILYSTFLTRSGILGETSVHAFTDLGMSGQLLIYLLFFVVLAIVLLFVNWKHMPKQAEEEAIWSREFWMFIGALVLLISAFQIIYTTSIPVWNKLFGLKMAPPSKVEEHYNAWQIPFAFLITVLTAVGQYFKYKNTQFNDFIKKIGIPLLLSLLLATVIAFALSFDNLFYILLLFSSVFAVTANAGYWIKILKGKTNKAGASIAHMGFGLILLGALISTSKKDTISINTSGTDASTIEKNLSNNKNIVLFINDTLQMGDYYVTYKGKHRGEAEKKINIYYEVEYLSKTPEGKYISQFILKPLVQTNPRMGNVAEPDTRHFLTADIYTHIAYAELGTPEEQDHSDEYTQAENHAIQVGDTVFSSNGIIVFEALDLNIDRKKLQLPDSVIAVGAKLKVYDVNKKVYEAMPVYVIHKNHIEPIEAKLDQLGLKFMFWKINPEKNEIEISLSEKKSNKREFIVMEAHVFPYINVLWMGCIVMITGTIVAIRERIKRKQDHVS